jgi:DNA-binding MarR family transcriptional regulator
MSQFVRSQGLSFLTHILAKLSDHFLIGFEQLWLEAGINAPIRTASTLRALSEFDKVSVTELAALLGQSHPWVVKWIDQLKKARLVKFESDPDDGRRTLVSLTAKGQVEARKTDLSGAAGELAFRRLLREADAEGLYEALWRVEEACRAKPMVERLREAHAELASQAARRKR